MQRLILLVVSEKKYERGRVCRSCEDDEMNTSLSHPACFVFNVHAMPRDVVVC